MSLEKRVFQILLLEDDQQVCDLIKAFVKMGSNNIHIVEAHDKGQASFKLENQEFDLILVDKVLPGKSGIEFISHVRRTIKHRSKKIILMSGSLEKEDVLSVLEYGVTEVLVKPFTFSQLMKKLKENLPEY